MQQLPHHRYQLGSWDPHPPQQPLHALAFTLLSTLSDRPSLRPPSCPPTSRFASDYWWKHSHQRWTWRLLAQLPESLPTMQSDEKLLNRQSQHSAMLSCPCTEECTQIGHRYQSGSNWDHSLRYPEQIECHLWRAAPESGVILAWSLCRRWRFDSRCNIHARFRWR